MDKNPRGASRGLGKTGNHHHFSMGVEWVEQLRLDLPELDRKATRQALRAYLDLYRDYRAILSVLNEDREELANETARYGQSGGRSEGTVSDQTAAALMKRKRMEEFCDRVDRAIGKALRKDEAKIIRMRFLGDEDATDDLVADKLHMSIRKYYRLKSKALWKLALALNVEEYVDGPPEPAA